MAARRLCPSCHHRLSPLAVECPVCGLMLGQRVLQRPLLFQASALKSQAPPVAPQALLAPALGRVMPVDVTPDPEEVGLALEPLSHLPWEDEAAEPEAPVSSFWPLVLLELSEAALLAVLNGVVAGVVLLSSGAGLVRVYMELWPFLLPLHVAVSWAVLMVPLVLTGQTVFMGPRGLSLGAELPERRIAFSLLHLVSVLAFPLSFLCLVLTPEHRTLAELLSGQEILQRPAPRLR